MVVSRLRFWILDLAGAEHDRHCIGQKPGAPAERKRIVIGQFSDSAGRRRMETAAGARLARGDDQKIRAHPGQFLCDVDAGALADGNEQDHGHDADDHAEHGKARTDLVRKDRFEGDPECFEEVHSIQEPSLKKDHRSHEGTKITKVFIVPCDLDQVRLSSVVIVSCLSVFRSYVQAFASSLTICPSFSVMIRLHRAATLWS